MIETSCDVLVIGGGVAGLAAAGALARQGFTVTILEARERLGGRVYTVRPAGWKRPAELGAEFIHAGNDAFWRLLSRHRLQASRVPSRHWLLEDHELREVDDITTRVENVTGRIAPRRMRGWSFADFLVGEKDRIPETELKLASDFIEGFQAAPKEKMSASAVAGETLDVTAQFHLARGYDKVVNALIAALPGTRVKVLTGAAVKSVTWRRGEIVALTGTRRFWSRAAIVTVPLGVLQAKFPQRGAIAFSPRLRAKEQLVAKMGMGHTIRINLRFTHRSWGRIVMSRIGQRDRAGFGFVHSPADDVQVWCH